jgi:RimJ/RimL family protein N-acetyltransferase
LGTHVVGKRIVVRYLLGSGAASPGASATDLLGTCLAWGDGVIVVQPDSGGPPVTVRWEDLVTGKPVPPRPSPRLRISPAAVQRRAMTLFPGLETTELGSWTLRRSTTYDARRANSVLAMDPVLGDVETAVTAVTDFYRGHGVRPIAAVLPGTAEEQAFRERGWVIESHDADTVFMLASVASLSRGLPGSLPTAEIEVRDGVATANLGDRARGVAAVAGDWVGYRGVEVDPAHRRQGLGLAVMASLIEWSAERGATTAYLQVLGDNAPAVALYEGLGFARHHEYRYLAATEA